MPDVKKVPLRIRLHLLLCRHTLKTYNPYISVPLADISARGIWAECECEKTWAL